VSHGSPLLCLGGCVWDRGSVVFPWVQLIRCYRFAALPSLSRGKTFTTCCFQAYCMRRLGGPRTLKPYNPQYCNVDRWVMSTPWHSTMGNHGARSGSYSAEHCALHQAVYRTAVLVLCGGRWWVGFVGIRFGGEGSRITPGVVCSWRLGKFLRRPGPRVVRGGRARGAWASEARI